MGQAQKCCCANEVPYGQDDIADSPSPSCSPSKYEDVIGGLNPQPVLPPLVLNTLEAAAPARTAEVNRKGNHPGREFLVTLRKTPQNSRLGVAVDASNPVFMTVDKVHLDVGMMCEWNAANPDQLVQVGDRIIAVNGYSGSTAEMTQQCRSMDVLEMQVRKHSLGDAMSSR